MEKLIMSFTELEKIGYSRRDLKKYCTEEDFPGYKSAGGGKWWVYVDKLPVFVERYNRRENILSEVVKRNNRRKIYGSRRA